MGTKLADNVTSVGGVNQISCPSNASSGAWQPASGFGIYDVDACARQCAHACAPCNFVSFSYEEDACIWFETCGMPLLPSDSFVTAHVLRLPGEGRLATAGLPSISVTARVNVRT